MTTLKLALSGDKKHVFVGKDTVTFPSTYGAPIALPNFDHNESDDPVHANGLNHVLFHHVRDTLYKRKRSDGSSGATYPNGIYNMQEISIDKFGAAIHAERLGITAVPNLDHSNNDGPTIAIKYFGKDLADVGVAAVNADFNFVSATPAVATVSAGGVLDTVAVGTSVITITEKNGSLSYSFTVTVVA